MGRLRRISIPVFLSCLVLGLGCGNGPQTGAPDGAGSDIGGSKADTAAADVPAAHPETGARDTGGAQSDVRATDVGGLSPDASVADASLSQPDGGKGEVLLSQPDGNTVDAVSLQPDGVGGDSPEPGPDGGSTEIGAWAPDSRTLDAGSAVPDGGASKDDTMRACVLATSCSAEGPYWVPGACLDYFGLTASRTNDVLFAHLLACAGAKTCSEFRSCWGGDAFTLETVWFSGTCQGNALTFTPADPTLPPVQFDCGAIGGVCELLASNSTSYGCNVQSCRRPLAPSCDGATASGCGGWAEYTSIDCARTGRICRIDGVHAVCDGTEGAACEGSEKVTCSGSVATYCGGSRHTTVDCARTHFRTRCAVGETSWEPCAPAGNECDPLSFRGECDGNKLKVCVDGSIVSVDCGTVGLAFCEPSSTDRYARCR
jgi:hypothetical protein